MTTAHGPHARPQDDEVEELLTRPRSPKPWHVPDEDIQAFAGQLQVSRCYAAFGLPAILRRIGPCEAWTHVIPDLRPTGLAKMLTALHKACGYGHATGLEAEWVLLAPRVWKFKFLYRMDIGMVCGKHLVTLG